MNMRLFSFLTAILFTSLSAFAQENEELHNASPAPRHIILFDPIFWKEELKLSAAQQRKIDLINSDFYQNIKVIYARKESSYTHDITDLLISRSESIWSTFHHRQKRKWEKLDSLNSLPGDAGRTQSAF